MKIMADTDVFVVGGGPIGLATAIAARMTGLRVIVAEQRTPPIDKTCGEGIFPDGVEILEQLGVVFPGGEGFPFQGIRFLEGQIRTTARFSGRPGLGLRRTNLHQALIRRAETVGIELLWGCRVEGIHRGGRVVEIDGGRRTTRWLVGADGMNSRVRRVAGLDAPSKFRRFGMRRHYRVAPWSEFVEVYWSNRGEAYVTPVGSGAICIAVLHREPRLEFDAALEAFPELAERIGSAPSESDDRRAGTVFRRLRRPVNGSIVLVGDAAGSVDAITGEGITVGLHQAAILARCLHAGSLSEYPAAFRRLMRLPGAMTSFMLGIGRRPRLRRGTLRLLEQMPWIFSRLVQLHTRTLSFSHPGGRLDAGRLARLPGALFGPLPLSEPSSALWQPAPVPKERR